MEAIYLITTAKSEWQTSVLGAMRDTLVKGVDIGKFGAFSFYEVKIKGLLFDP